MPKVEDLNIANQLFARRVTSIITIYDSEAEDNSNYRKAGIEYRDNKFAIRGIGSIENIEVEEDLDEGGYSARSSTIDPVLSSKA